MASIDEFVRGATHGAHAAAASIPNLIAGIVRLNLFSIFLIYAAALAFESLRREHYYFSLLVIVSVLLFFAVLIVVFVKNWRAQWKKADVPAADLGSVWLYAAPAAALVVATAIIGLLDPDRFQFQDPLLRETAYQAHRFVYWITNL